jgi:hypothetical protein
MKTRKHDRKRFKVRAIRACLWYGFLPWQWYEKTCHYKGMNYFSHLGMNLGMAWKWMMGRQNLFDVLFEIRVNGQ